MKMLEAVAENLIAQGSYTYLRNGEPAGVSETWAVYGGPNGTVYTQAERQAPDYGSTITVGAWAEAGKISQFMVEWKNTSPEAVALAQAHYTITERHIEVERSINNSPFYSRQLPTPPNLVVSPLLRCFQGPAIKQVAELGHGERVPVLVPWIHDPRNTELLLSPQLDSRSAKLLNTENDLDIYAYVGGNYDDAARFWLNADGQMVKYELGEWRVENSY